jgi:hypothetical protein
MPFRHADDYLSPTIVDQIRFVRFIQCTGGEQPEINSVKLLFDSIEWDKQ